MQRHKKAKDVSKKIFVFLPITQMACTPSSDKTSLSVIGCCLISKRSKSTMVHFYFHSHWVIALLRIDRGMLLFKGRSTVYIDWQIGKSALSLHINRFALIS